MRKELGRAVVVCNAQDRLADKFIRGGLADRGEFPRFSMTVEATQDHGPTTFELGLGCHIVGGDDFADVGGRAIKHPNLGVRNHRKILLADVIQEENHLGDIFRNTH